MRKWISVLFATLTIMSPRGVRGDMWGGDVIVLTQILAQTIQQLAQLRAILNNGQDSLGLIRDINRGINDSLHLMRTVSPNSNPGIYAEWAKVEQALAGLQGIYGVVVPSTDSRIQQDADQSVAEAINMNNSLYKYTGEIDAIGEQVKGFSHQVSPGGAQKLTAQTLGIMLNVMNASLRAQATGLKLQAQTIAIQNHRDKAATQHMLSSSDQLKAAMKNERVDFSIPRF